MNASLVDAACATKACTCGMFQCMPSGAVAGLEQESHAWSVQACAYNAAVPFEWLLAQGSWIRTRPHAQAFWSSGHEGHEDCGLLLCCILLRWLVAHEEDYQECYAVSIELL